MPWKELAPSDLDYSAAIGADQDERIALAEEKARADAQQWARDAIVRFLGEEVARQLSRGRTEADILSWFAYVIREGHTDAIDPQVHVVNEFIDRWGVGPAAEALGAAMASVNGDSFNEVRR